MDVGEKIVLLSTVSLLRTILRLISKKFSSVFFFSLSFSSSPNFFFTLLYLSILLPFQTPHRFMSSGENYIFTLKAQGKTFASINLSFLLLLLLFFQKKKENIYNIMVCLIIIHAHHHNPLPKCIRVQLAMYTQSLE